MNTSRGGSRGTHAPKSGGGREDEGGVGGWRRGEERRGRGPAGAQVRPDAHLGQLAELVGVQQQLLQAAGVAVDLLGDVDQRAVALVDTLHMTVAPPQGDAVEHRRPRRPVRAAETRAPSPLRPAAPLRPLPAPRSWAPVLARSSRRPSRSETLPRNLGREPRRVPARPPAGPIALQPRRRRRYCRAELPTRGRRATEHALQWARAEDVSRPGGCSAPGFPGDLDPQRGREPGAGRSCTPTQPGTEGASGPRRKPASEGVWAKKEAGERRTERGKTTLIFSCT